MATASAGEIRPEVCYSLDAAKRESRMGEWAFRTARRKGLVVHYRGGRGFVMGADLIRYLTGDAQGQES